VRGAGDTDRSLGGVHPIGDANATFCATLVDEWARAGCTDAVVAPGSRSTPLALAMVADDRLRVQVFHDERAAAFAALGAGLAGGRPAILLCTSGTAATHLHAAVAEADLSNVPLLVCTADRPPELWQVGAPQTIDQTRLYGGAVRFFAEPGVPDDAARHSWRSLGARAVAEALGASGRPGPVHLNLPFREPLVGEPGDLPPGRAGGAPWHQVAPLAGSVPPSTEVVDRLAPLVDGRRGVVVAGAGIADPDGVSALAARLGWPVLADHRSGCRALPEAVGHADPLLRVPGFARRHRPEVVLRLGEPLSSKVVGQWLAASGAVEVAVDRHGSWRDPDRILDVVVRAEPGALARCLAGRLTAGPVGELTAWRAADEAAAAALDEVLADAGPVTEPGTVRAALEATPGGGALVVASSMPVRDLEWFGGRRADVAVFANRGANGIDGVIATAIGVASTGRPTVCVLGDVAFLHDSTALIGLAGRDVDLTVVVIDNDGGGIFSFLPQAAQLPAERFERLFGTPHGVDLSALAGAHDLAVASPEGGQADVAGAIAHAVADGGPRVVRVRTDRQANVALHQRLERAVAAACGEEPG
jgi:2-succinyl-5-enolpyruvyl-6-hydroxy-3-cyclohexene-1-carboxylate synthase